MSNAKAEESEGPQGPIEFDYVDGTTDPFQYRLICLKMAHMAEEATIQTTDPPDVTVWTGSDMSLERIMERAERYWEFIVGVDTEMLVNRKSGVVFRPDFEVNDE